MSHRLAIVCSALVLALATVLVAPSFLKAQGQQGQRGAQAPVAVDGQRQGVGQGLPNAQQGAQGGRGGGRGRGNQPEVPSKPTPRWPDGHPRIGAPSIEEKGIWGA